VWRFKPSFRTTRSGDPESRYYLAPNNFEIPGLVLTHHPGMTTRTDHPDE
jgi:hypothetical protein